MSKYKYSSKNMNIMHDTYHCNHLEKLCKIIAEIYCKEITYMWLVHGKH